MSDLRFDGTTDNTAYTLRANALALQELLPSVATLYMLGMLGEIQTIEGDFKNAR